MVFVSTDKQMRPRDHRDFYPTPIGLARAGLQFVDNYAPEPDNILDPGAGTGVWGRAARELWPDARIEGVDLHFEEKPTDYDDWFVKDYTAGHSASFDLIIGNPPYKHMEAFVRRSWEHHLRDYGRMIFLARIAFMAGQKRHAGLWREIRPQFIIPLGMRPSFTGNGKTDATDYMLVVWNKGRPEHQTHVVWGFEYERKETGQLSLGLEIA